MNITWEITKLFIKITGIKVYEQQLEFGLHTFMGLFFGALGYTLHWLVFVFYALYVLQDEFYGDKHWTVFIGKDPEWKDLLWDLFSKLIGVVIFSIIYLVFGG